MPCDRIHKPELTKEQLAECDKCKWASKLKLWCCKMGFWIRPNPHPPPNRILTLPPKATMAKSLGRETAKYVKAGRPKRTPTEQAVCMATCEACEWFIAESKLGPRCSKCGCCMKLKTRWATAHCPLKKW